MKMLDVADVKWVEDNIEDIKKISTKLEENKAPVKLEPKTTVEEGAFAKMKSFVRKAVDCCIE